MTIGGPAAWQWAFSMLSLYGGMDCKQATPQTVVSFASTCDTDTAVQLGVVVLQVLVDLLTKADCGGHSWR